MAKKEKLETPLEREEREKKLVSFSERWEEELKEKLFNITVAEQEIHLVPEEKYDWHKPRPNEEWDVPITEEIKYFDPELSYEITGYRPITMEKGLDFEPDLFRERAILFERTGKYEDFPKHSKPYRDFWNEEFRRCQQGLTIGKYRLTGDHYFFLNYYRMEVIKDDAISGAGRKESFPSFLAKQYEFFHYIEMCERLSKDVCLLKARGLGASEMLASLAVRPYTTNRGYHVMLTCKDEAKLDPLREKCWRQLDWLNLNTHCGMRHVRQAINNREVKRASIKTQDGVEWGWKSQITTVIGDNANKIRGSRTDRLIYDECFDPDTKIIMSDYSIRAIKDIGIGDCVLGPDGLPKEVIEVCSGIDDMYQVDQISGNSYIVNSHHPLYILNKTKWPDRKIITITPDEYCKQGLRFKRTSYGIHSKGINGNGNYPVDPYYFGLWLGDGYSSCPNQIIVGNGDYEIEDWIMKFFETNFKDGVVSEYIELNRKESSKIIKLIYPREKNPIINTFKKLGLFNNKHIPKEIINCSLDYKLKVLAGIIDTDGSVKSKNRKGSCYSIEMSRENLIRDIKYLAESCGFRCHISSRIKKQHSVNGNMIKSDTIGWTVNIKGNIDKIPVLLPRKKNIFKRTLETNISGLKIKNIGKGSYYGITLKSYNNDYDNLFLLSDFTIVHNCGSNDILTDSWIKGDALVSLGGKRFGQKYAVGTGGDDFAVTGLSNMFGNPEAYNVLPFKNYDTDDGKPELVSFFIPAHKFALTSKYLDNRGVTNHLELKKYYLKIREKLTDKDYLSECAEHCFTPREALSKHGDNVFDSVPISERLVQIKVQGNYTKPKKMALFWDVLPGGIKKVRAVEHPDSHLLVVEPPILDESGQPFKNLYVAGIDAIDMGKSDSATDYDVSDFCVVIKKRQFGQNPPKYVALYRYRPNNIRDAFEMTMRLLVWYNCKALLEYTKISIQTYFKEKGMGHLFMPRPKVALQGGVRRPGKNLIGIQGTPAMIQHGLELIQNFLADYWYTIDFEAMLDDMLNYSIENKRKFDIIAAMICAEIGDEDMTGLTPAVISSIKNQWRDIGYYIDENGYRRRGVIPDGRNWKAS